MKKIALLLASIITCVSLFTHFYRIDKTFIFNGDEARDVLITKKIIDTHKPVLLGPETSVGNMYLGPLYYYLMTPALLATHMQPVGPAAMIGLFAVATSLLIYIWGKRHFGMWVGFCAGMTYALIPIMVHYSRSSWNPNLVPFCMTLLLYVYDLKSKWRWVLLGALAGSLFQLHYVALSAVVLVALAMFLRESHRNFLDVMRYLFTALIGFAVITAPFWLFEARHDWVNTHAFVTYLTLKQEEGGVHMSYMARLFTNSILVAKGIMGSQALANSKVPVALIWITELLLFLFPLWLYKREKNKAPTMFLWSMLVGTLLIVSLLKEPIYVHYISHLFPILSLLFGILVVKASAPIRLLTITFLLSLLIWSLPILRYNLAEITSSQIDRAEHVAAYIETHAAGRPYNIVNTQGTSIAAVQYYLSLKQNRPENTLTNLIFDICEGKPCPNDDETTTLLFLTGPTHPAITEYLGHPQINEFSGTRHIISNEQVSYDTWVATIMLDP